MKALILLALASVLLSPPALQGVLGKVFFFEQAEKWCIHEEYYRQDEQLRATQEWAGRYRNATEKASAEVRINKCMEKMVCGASDRPTKSPPRDGSSSNHNRRCRWQMKARLEVEVVSRWLPDCPHYRGHYMRHPFDPTCRQYFGCLTTAPFGIHIVAAFACSQGMMFDGSSTGSTGGCVTEEEYGRRHGGGSGSNGCRAIPWPHKALEAFRFMTGTTKDVRPRDSNEIGY